jgi:phosphohistidine phosphatase
MRRLILLRHAKSDWNVPGQPDIERSLAPRGLETAPKMGAYMRAEGLVPDAAIVSAATRTRQTFALIASALGRPVPEHVDRTIYEADPRAILAAIASHGGDAGTLLVVGHNPGLQMLGLMLARRDGAETRRRLHAKFATAALLVLDFRVEDWIDLPPEHAVIERFVSPASLGMITVDD